MRGAGGWWKGASPDDCRSLSAVHGARAKFVAASTRGNTPPRIARSSCNRSSGRLVSGKMDAPRLTLVRRLASRFQTSLTATVLRCAEFRPLSVVCSHDGRKRWSRGPARGICPTEHEPSPVGVPFGLDSGGSHPWDSVYDGYDGLHEHRRAGATRRKRRRGEDAPRTRGGATLTQTPQEPSCRCGAHRGMRSPGIPVNLFTISHLKRLSR